MKLSLVAGSLIGLFQVVFAQEQDSANVAESPSMSSSDTYRYGRFDKITDSESSTYSGTSTYGRFDKTSDTESSFASSTSTYGRFDKTSRSESENGAMNYPHGNARFSGMMLGCIMMLL
ncbi:uncharacterized protein Ecym_6433 [Eremothecium cymbalariae DBVPG|uniref:Uncharacterized protein n=1 Tax=Eremothecium cymbalariae (strain CBS 270.75 / DBVPG 7215 / KCTC 17166 / NRRL Y-17582) TaxID=931890 RepID=G8JUM4_ERECY|nr:hypothetical protein Ecym_6433 [Eremothecium cymbalariae DBVPG\